MPPELVGPLGVPIRVKRLGPHRSVCYNIRHLVGYNYLSARHLRISDHRCSSMSGNSSRRFPSLTTPMEALRRNVSGIRHYISRVGVGNRAKSIRSGFAQCGTVFRYPYSAIRVNARCLRAHLRATNWPSSGSRYLPGRVSNDVPFRADD